MPCCCILTHQQGHRDLARVTPEQAIDWVDHLQFGKKITAKSVRDVWLASVKATAGFMIEKKKLKANPFAGIKVRGVTEGKADDEKAFTDEQAKTILTATLATPSHLISAETRARTPPDAFGISTRRTGCGW
jgi:hypothetical protein